MMEAVPTRHIIACCYYWCPTSEAATFGQRDGSHSDGCHPGHDKAGDVVEAQSYLSAEDSVPSPRRTC